MKCAAKVCDIDVKRNRCSTRVAFNLVLVVLSKVVRESLFNQMSIRNRCVTPLCAFGACSEWLPLRNMN